MTIFCFRQVVSLLGYIVNSFENMRTWEHPRLLRGVCIHPTLLPYLFLTTLIGKKIPTFEWNQEGEIHNCLCVLLSASVCYCWGTSFSQWGVGKPLLDEAFMFISKKKLQLFLSQISQSKWLLSFLGQKHLGLILFLPLSPG